jgi:hypothetical protein
MVIEVWAARASLMKGLLGGWSPERPVRHAVGGAVCQNEIGTCALAKATTRHLRMRKRKRPARTSPGEAQLFTIAILHSARFFPRVKKMYRYQQNGGSYPVDSASANAAAHSI